MTAQDSRATDRTLPGDSTVFCYPHQFLAENAADVVARIVDRTGVNRISVAAAYHHARDIFPHHPTVAVVHLEGGVTYFRPDFSRYPSDLRPQPSELCESVDPLKLIVEAAERVGIKVDAWTVFLHNSRLGVSVPSATVENVLGDRLVSSLCPANPVVREFSCALAGDLARRGIDHVAAESLNFHPLEHGHHHERYFIDLSPMTRTLLAACFCEHCRTAALAGGIDVETAARRTREHLEHALRVGDPEMPAPASLNAVRERIGAEVAAYLANRMVIVADLVSHVSEAARGGGAGLEFLDEAGAGGGDLRAELEELGVDPQRLMPHVRYYSIGAYGDAPDTMLAQYAGLVDRSRTRVVIRSMPPDVGGAADLIDRVEGARRAGFNHFGFYHFDLMREAALQWVGAALRSRLSPGRGPAIQNRAATDELTRIARRSPRGS